MRDRLIKNRIADNISADAIIVLVLRNSMIAKK